MKNKLASEILHSYILENEEDSLSHHGILGMKWGVRRFQPYPKGYSGGGKFTGQSPKSAPSNKNEAPLTRKSSYDGLVKAVADYDNFRAANNKTFSKSPKKYKKKDIEIARESSNMLDKIGNYGAAYIVKNKIAEHWYKNDDGSYNMKEAKRYFLEESDPIQDKSDFRDPKVQKEMADAYYEVKTVRNAYNRAVEQERNKILQEYNKAWSHDDTPARRQAYEKLDKKVMDWMINTGLGKEFYTDDSGKINKKAAHYFYLDNVGESFWSDPDFYAKKIAEYYVPRDLAKYK